MLFCLLSKELHLFLCISVVALVCGAAAGQRSCVWLNKMNTGALLSTAGKPKLLAVATGCDGWWLSLAWMYGESGNQQAQNKPMCVHVFGEEGSERI